MVVDLDNPLWSMLIPRVYDELAAHQYRLSLVAEHGDPTDIESHVLGGSVDGVIVSTASLESTLPDLLRKRGVPTVLLHRFAEGSEIDACVADNRAGGSMAAQILLKAGHCDIGALFGPSETSTGLERERGFTETLADAGISLDPRSVVRGDFTYEHGTAAVTRLIASDALPRALFCANDIIAVGAMNAARAAGLRVPEDLALVGFDDLAQSAWPIIDLTTINVPFDDMLRSAVSLLVSRIGGEESTWRRVIHPVSPVLRSTHQLS